MKKISMEELERMKNIDLETVDTDTLVDIKDIVIDTQLSREERIDSFLSQIKNPYCYKCGKIIVKVSFDNTGINFEDIMKSYLKLL